MPAPRQVLLPPSLLFAFSQERTYATQLVSAEELSLRRHPSAAIISNTKHCEKLKQLPETQDFP
jgi:hypothetical protein